MLLLGISTMLIFMVYLVPRQPMALVEQIEGGVLAVVTELQKILTRRATGPEARRPFSWCGDVLQEASDELRRRST